MQISYISYEESKQIDAMLTQNKSFTMDKLIDQAGSRISNWIDDHINNQALIGVIGTGNNGKDVMSAFKKLTKNKELYLFLKNNKIKETDAFKSLMGQKKITIIDKLPLNSNTHTIIDGLFGTGLNRPLTKETESLINRINQSKNIVSIDIPSGLREDNRTNVHVIATVTLSMMFPKNVFLDSKKREKCGDIYLMNFDIPKKDLHPYILPNTIDPYIKL